MAGGGGLPLCAPVRHGASQSRIKRHISIKKNQKKKKKP